MPAGGLLVCAEGFVRLPEGFGTPDLRYGREKTARNSAADEGFIRSAVGATTPEDWPIRVRTESRTPSPQSAAKNPIKEFRARRRPVFASPTGKDTEQR